MEEQLLRMMDVGASGQDLEPAAKPDAPKKQPSSGTLLMNMLTTAVHKAAKTDPAKAKPKRSAKPGLGIGLSAQQI